MPARTPIVTEGNLRATVIPQHSKLYGAISHGEIIDTTRKELSTVGLRIKQEIYKSSIDGQIAQGIYHLTHSDDPEIGLMFAWANSYNKTMKFKCASGAHVFVCSNGMISGNLANYSRKHFGKTALADAVHSIQKQLGDAHIHYRNLIATKEALKNIRLSKKDMSSLVGILYADKEILGLSQVGVIKREMDTPSFNYNADKDSAWAFYNHITLALKNSHPFDYITNHQTLHTMFVNEFGLLVSSESPEVQAELVVEESSERVVIDAL